MRILMICLAVAIEAVTTFTAHGKTVSAASPQPNINVYAQQIDHITMTK